MSIFKFVIVTFICLFYQTSIAQFSSIELMTGATFTTLTGANTESSERKSGFKIGGLVNVPISHKDYLKIGIVYNRTPFLIEGEYTDVNSIVIPTLFKLGLIKNTFIYFGPELHIYIDQLILEYCNAHNCEWYKDPFKGGIANGDIVLSSGLEFTLNYRLNISVGTSIGLTKLLDSTTLWEIRNGYYFSTSIGLGVNL